MKSMKKVISLLLVLMIAASAFALVSCGKKEETKDGKEVTITFTVVGKDGEKTDFVIQTTKTTLRGALDQENLIEIEDGMVYAVNGVRADYFKDGAYWALYIGDEMAMAGVNDITLTDGAAYSFVYTPA